MAFVDVLLSIGTYLLTSLALWLSALFIVPFQKPIMFWILIPIWISFIFTDFFQEKEKTSLGNAVTNGAVMLWVAADWTRHLLKLIGDRTIKLNLVVYGEFALCLLAATFAIIIIIQGIRGKSYVRFIGRVRETSYVLLVFSPVIYQGIELTLKYFIACVIFFPAFYYFFEILDKIIPNPKTYEAEKEEKNNETGLGDLGGPPPEDIGAPQPLFPPASPPGPASSPGIPGIPPPSTPTGTPGEQF